MIKGLLFDMDGVIVDSEPLITYCAVTVLRERFGVNVKSEDFLEFTGMGEDGFIGGAVRKNGGTYTLDMKDKTYDLYEELAPTRLPVYADVEKNFRLLHESGYKIAVCSSADGRKVNANLAVSKIAPYVDAIISGDDVERKKPFPDIYLYGATRLGLDASDCAVVEDALSGITAGKRAGCTVIAVPTSFKKEALKDCGADVVLDKIGDIFGCVSSLGK